MFKNLLFLGVISGFILLFSNQTFAAESNDLDELPEEDAELLFEVLNGSRIYYDEDDNFVGINEDDLSELKGTEQEYIIGELREEGLLHTPSAVSTSNPHDQLRTEILNLGDDETRAAHAECMIDNLGGNIGEAVSNAIINEFTRANVLGVIQQFGRVGINVTIPGMVWTIAQCGVETN